MKLATAILLALIATGAKAQTISPVISECGLKCRGTFTVTNNSTRSQLVNVNINSLIFKDKKPVAVDLKDVDIQLDASTARIPPLGQHEFSYKIFCNSSPCIVRFAAEFFGGRTKEGVVVMLGLPSVVYSCKKQKNCRATTLKENGVQ